MTGIIFFHLLLFTNGMTTFLKQGGKSRRWTNLRDTLAREIAEKKEAFLDKMIEEGRNGKDFHAAIKRLAGIGSRKWSVKDLFPNESEESACESVAEYFAGVGGDGEDVPPDPRVDPSSLGHFSEERTEALLKRLKKTESHVPGDPLPHLIRKSPRTFAVPLTKIFNMISNSGVWPDSWKTEYVTVIPKTSNPATLSECRNISCTAIFSKTLENALLDQLRSELTPDPDQYGGIKNCGAEHLLINLWESILESMDNGDSAAVLMGVDFEKAFNRMNHAHCVEQLAKLGASPGSISLAQSFLENRNMIVRIGSAQSRPRKITRGSPQGSVLGCLLFCVTTQNLGSGLMGAPATPPPMNVHDLPAAGTPAAFQSAHRLPRLGDSDVRFFPQDDSSGSDDDINFWETRPAPPEHLVNTDLEGAVDELGGPVISKFVYVDDTTFFQPVPLSEAVRHLTTSQTIEEVHPELLSACFANIDREGTEIGMKINGSKTQLLAIGTNNGCNTVASIRINGEKITSGKQMKLVGFNFGSSPDVSAHIDGIKKAFRRKIWLLYHLRNAGMKGKKLFQLYCCYVRSVIEYCSVVYHSLLNVGQNEMLERLHRHAVRICFGNDQDVGIVMEREAIEKLEERRLRRIDSFIVKNFTHPRFGPTWFPLRPEGERNLRGMRHVHEARARTTRFFNSPVSFMRRRANIIAAGQ